MATRALVLGAGGPTGVAWEAGILAGLADAGVDLADADLIVGTSAGSLVGALLATGADVHELYAAQLDGAGVPSATARVAELAADAAAASAPPAPSAPPASAAVGSARGAVLTLAWMLMRHRDPERYRLAVGRLALTARTMPEAQWRATFEGRLPVRDWPERRLIITAVDAASGEFAALDRDGDASLVEAVAASTAVPGVWPPISIGGRRFMDGGMRSATNADLAAGHDRVVIVAPIARASGPLTGAGAHAAALTRSGSEVALVRPDKATRRAIGWNPMDWSRRAPAARAGREQAAAVADEVAAVWSG